jgi:hypothetical protein
VISPYPACLLRYNGAAVEWNIIASIFIAIAIIVGGALN